MHVFTGSEPGAVIGDQVDVEATVTEFFDDTELIDVSFTNNGAGTPITPVAVTVAQAATEPYEGMLVTLTDVTSFVDPYSCAGDGAGGCSDAALWQVNGSIVVYDRVYLGADWAAQTSQAGVTGTMSFRHETRRIQPRSAADLVP